MTASLATRRFPIEVRSSNLEHTEWTTYSRHRSMTAARRAFRECCLLVPDRWVQLRNDFTGEGVITNRWTAPVVKKTTKKVQPSKAHEEFWQGWIKHLHRDLGAVLALTIDVEPSDDENIRAAVNAAIALEQETTP